MPTISYKARLYDRQDEIDVPINVSISDYNVLFPANPSNEKSKKRTSLLQYCMQQACPLILMKERLKCFRCKKTAQKSVNTPGIHCETRIISDMMFIPIFNNPMCEAEAHRITRNTLEELTKLSPHKKELKEAWGKYCAFCKRVEEKSGPKLKHCSRCKCMYYCNKDCQVKHWKAGHKNTCKPADAPVTTQSDDWAFRNAATMRQFAEKLVSYKLTMNDGQTFTIKIWDEMSFREQKAILANYFTEQWDRLDNEQKAAKISKMPQECHGCGQVGGHMSPDAGVGHTRLICSECAMRLLLGGGA